MCYLHQREGECCKYSSFCYRCLLVIFGKHRLVEGVLEKLYQGEDIRTKKEGATDLFLAGKQPLAECVSFPLACVVLAGGVSFHLVHGLLLVSFANSLVLGQLVLLAMLLLVLWALDCCLVWLQLLGHHRGSLKPSINKTEKKNVN